MKMCRLEEVGCEFSGVGCNGLFIREDQEEHTRQNSQKHLTLTASLAVETKEQLQQKLLEQDKKHKEEEGKLRQKIEEQEKKIEELAKKVMDKDNEHNEEEQRLKQKIEELEKKQEKELDEQKLELVGQIQDSKDIVDRLVEQQNILQAQLSELPNQLGLTRTITMMGFTKAKNESSMWKSPAMYTHPYGYKFFFEINANGVGIGCGKAVYFSLWSTPGDFDSRLKWPVKMKITLELINQHGGDNTVTQEEVTLRKCDRSCVVANIGNIYNSGFGHLIYHSALHNYLVNDTLCFGVSTLVF